MWDRILALIYLTTMFFALPGRWNDRFSIQETSFSFMGLLGDLHSELGGCSLTDGAGKWTRQHAITVNYAADGIPPSPTGC